MAAQNPTPAVDPTSGHAREIEAQVIAQAVQDAAFRARVVADPKSVFAEMGLRIPPEIQIQAVQETAQQYYLVLPAVEQTGHHAGASLSDAQLETVAGGAWGATAAPSAETQWTGCGSGQSGCVSGGSGC